MKKRSFLLAALLAALCTQVQAQSAIERVVELANQKRYTALDRLLPEVRDSLSTMNYLMIRAQTDTGLRRFGPSIEGLVALLQGDAGPIDGPTRGALIDMLLTNLERAGDYGGAAALVKQLWDQDPEGQQQLAYTYNFFDKQAQLQTRFERPRSDVTIPFRLDSIGRGRAMIVEGVIGGRAEPFFFDTGLTTAAAVSDAFARSHGIRSIGLETGVEGIAGIQNSWLGTTDSLCVGGMVLRNPMITVLPTTPLDSIGVSAVLGSRFMIQAGEFEVHGKQGMIVFPATKTAAPDYAPNMAMQADGQFYAEVISAQDTLSMHLDSGNTKSGLSNSYFSRHKEQIESTLTQRENRMGGVGGILVQAGYLLPSLPLRTGAAEGQLHDVDIAAGFEFNGEQGEDGSLGTDFLTAFDRVRIDFERMFVAAESDK